MKWTFIQLSKNKVNFHSTRSLHLQNEINFHSTLKNEVDFRSTLKNEVDLLSFDFEKWIRSEFRSVGQLNYSHATGNITGINQTNLEKNESVDQLHAEN